MDNQECYNKIKLSIATQEDIFNYFNNKLEKLNANTKQLENNNMLLLDNMKAMQKMELDILKNIEILEILENLHEREQK